MAVPRGASAGARGAVTIHLTLEVDGNRADRLVELLRDLEGVKVLQAGPAPRPDVAYIR